jgi:hypothetical protein
MPTSQPICASGSHEVRRPKPIPVKVREACLAMIYGRPDDDNAVPLDFVAAARFVGIRPNILRKWLHKPAVMALIRRERAAYRVACCAANEYRLKKVADTSANGMAIIGACNALEGLDADNSPHRQIEPVSPHITIVIRQPDVAPAPAMQTIEHTPQLERLDPYRPVPQYDSEGHRLPLFDPFRDR